MSVQDHTTKTARTPLGRELLRALVAIALFTVLLGVAYPLAITGIGQGLFPGAANGSQVRLGGHLVGSSLIGQQFATPVLGKDGKPVRRGGEAVTRPAARYFQTRPSATTPPDNAAATTFSNLGPNSKATERGDAKRISEYLALNRPYDPGLTVAEIPVDAINTSASGVDPEISVANADIQAHRVAAVRHLPLAKVMALVEAHTKGRFLGVLGEPGVNVLEVNLALKGMAGGH